MAAIKRRLGLEWADSGRGDFRRTIGPEDVFAYAYAVFNAPSYRTRYSEFLKRDFPRLPLTSSIKLFAELAEKGQELVGVHLLQAPRFTDPITSFPEEGSNLVEKPGYSDRNRRVWINRVEYFEGISSEVWEFHVGGYQVCDKWLKDRKGRQFSYDDTQHYREIVVALKETIRLMAEIDALIPGWPLP